MLRMFRKKTLLDDLNKHIKQVTKTGAQAEILNHLLFDLRNRQTLQLALKLKDDIHNSPVIYSDADFLLARNPRNIIGKMMTKHNDSLPAQFTQQRSNVTDEHLDGVLGGTEKEETYTPKSWQHRSQRG